MSLRSVQAPGAVVIVRPRHFVPNEQTRTDNAFQSPWAPGSEAAFADAAYDEVTAVSDCLLAEGIQTHVFDDNGRETPDSVFPNNWFSTHPGGHVAIYPMFAANRRKERRSDVLDMLKGSYRVQDVIDYSGLEPDGLYLEGTGAMVLDHIDRVAYATQSNRTNPIALERFSTHFNYEPMVFEAADRNGVLVYHTNVLMCIATRFAMVGLDMILDQKRRSEIRERLTHSGREVISLTNDQIDNFAGNAIELQGKDGRILAMSARARQSLTASQIAAIEQSAKIVPLGIPTIEHAGGSVRCMLAGIHLAPRQARQDL